MQVRTTGSKWLWVLVCALPLVVYGCDSDAVGDDAGVDASAEDGGAALDAGSRLDAGPATDAGPRNDSGPPSDDGGGLDGATSSDAGSDAGARLDASAPVVCGARAGDTCGPTEYCDFSEAAMCGFADGTGTCQPRPEICTEDCPGVCGCDGTTYCNRCSAASMGMDTLRDGACATTS